MTRKILCALCVVFALGSPAWAEDADELADLVQADSRITELELQLAELTDKLQAVSHELAASQSSENAKRPPALARCSDATRPRDCSRVDNPLDPHLCRWYTDPDAHGQAGRCDRLFVDETPCDNADSNESCFFLSQSLTSGYCYWDFDVESCIYVEESAGQ